MHRARSNTTRATILRRLLGSRKYTLPSLVSKPEQGYEFYNRNRGRFDKRRKYIPDMESGSDGRIGMDNADMLRMPTALNLQDEGDRARWLDRWLDGGCEEEEILDHYWVEEYELTGKYYARRAWGDGEPCVGYCPWKEICGSKDDAADEVEVQELSSYLTEMIDEISLSEPVRQTSREWINSDVSMAPTTLESCILHAAAPHSVNGDSSPRLTSTSSSDHGKYPVWLLQDIHALLEGHNDENNCSKRGSVYSSYTSANSQLSPTSICATTAISSPLGRHTTHSSPKPSNQVAGIAVYEQRSKAGPMLEVEGEGIQPVKGSTVDYSSSISTNLDIITPPPSDRDCPTFDVNSVLLGRNTLDHSTSAMHWCSCLKNAPCMCTSSPPAEQMLLGTALGEGYKRSEADAKGSNESASAFAAIAFDHLLLSLHQASSPSANAYNSCAKPKKRVISANHVGKSDIKRLRLLNSGRKDNCEVNRHNEKTYSLEPEGNKDNDRHEEKAEDSEQSIALPSYFSPFQQTPTLRPTYMGLRSTLASMSMPIYKAIALRVAEREMTSSQSFTLQVPYDPIGMPTNSPPLSPWLPLRPKNLVSIIKPRGQDVDGQEMGREEAPKKMKREMKVHFIV